MTHADLFAGIGGFSLAAEAVGWTNIFQVEKDKFCLSKLKKNFPHVTRFKDIKTTYFGQYRGAIDVLSGGFPCQPVSAAGKRRGDKDDRFLWPEYARAIREIQPTWILPENVSGIITWQRGVLFEQVCAQMEAEGYEVLPLVIPAAGLNAPHRRERVWFVAHARHHGLHGSEIRRGLDPGDDGDQTRPDETIKPEGRPSPRPGTAADTKGRRDSRRLSGLASSDDQVTGSEESREGHSGAGHDGEVRHAANAPAQRSQGSRQAGKRGLGKETGTQPGSDAARAIAEGYWDQWPAQPALCRRDDGIPHRVDRIKSLGNAIVPQVAIQIFKTIQLYEDLLHRPPDRR